MLVLHGYTGNHKVHKMFNASVQSWRTVLLFKQQTLGGKTTKQTEIIYETAIKKRNMALHVLCRFTFSPLCFYSYPRFFMVFYFFYPRWKSSLPVGGRTAKMLDMRHIYHYAYIKLCNLYTSFLFCLVLTSRDQKVAFNFTTGSRWKEGSIEIYYVYEFSAGKRRCYGDAFSIITTYFS